jgi:glucosamine--fructose-6-phosphate aminotransferase (isomerizing)
MCGIIGYIGPRDATPYLLEGLRRLEYRGYDSAGVATVDHGSLLVTKRAGRLDNLAQALHESPSPGHIGIGHTRWATHGPATDVNAHPHLGGEGGIAIVHNGVIENFRAIKTRLQEEGYLFHSATDSEVIAHLIAS